MPKDNVIKTKEDSDKIFFDQRYFAFLDILGFKELVKNNNHTVLTELYKRLVNYQVEYYSQFTEINAKGEKARLKEYYDPTGLRLVNISDSIMFWTDNTKLNSLYEIVSAVKMIMSISMSVGIPLRGAIVKGDIEIFEKGKNLSVVGRGLVEAYEMEGQQNWSGCLIDERIFIWLNSINRVFLNKNSNISIEKADWLIKKHPVPFKIKGEEFVKELFTVNWAEGSNKSEREIRESFSMHNKRIKETDEIKASIEKKIDNTIEYWQKHK